MPSRNGIYYELKDSPWHHSRNGVRFYFSSETHYNRFLREVDKRESQMTASMSARIGCPIVMNLPASIQLYRQVETRGFYITFEQEGEEVLAPCLERLVLDGLILSFHDCEAPSNHTMLP